MDWIPEERRPMALALAVALGVVAVLVGLGMFLVDLPIWATDGGN